MKYLMIVCDGMADVPPKTPLMLAKHTGMDFLAVNGRCGQIDFGYKNVVDSDIGFLKILGCYGNDYPGRGYLEVLGAGLDCNEDDVCIRANFSTLDKNELLIDRRAGRDETGLEEMAEKLDGMEIDDVKFTVKKSSGHRLVIIMSGKGLSDAIIPNDMRQVGVAVPQISSKKPGAKKTASVLNKFLRQARKILEAHPANKRRKFAANCILIRSAGHKEETKSFEKRFGMKGCCIAGVAIARGVAKFLGMDFIHPKGATCDQHTDLDSKALAALTALKKYDLVFLHINGCDILSHDKKPEEKRKFIEKIDSHVVKKILDSIDLNEVAVVITSDHCTNSSPKHKGYEHSPLPVPFIMCGCSIKPGACKKFDEDCNELKLNNELLPTLLRLANPRKSLFLQLQEE